MNWTDTDRLDFLDNLTTGYGNGWILRWSTTGRGIRLHETSQDGVYPTPRDAIDAGLEGELDLVLED